MLGDESLSRRNWLEASAVALAAATNLGTDLGLAAPGSTSRPKKTILGIGAHLDDVEWGAGGLMLKAVAAGHRAVIVQAAGDYSNWPFTQNHQKEVREGAERVAREMGVEKIFLDYKYHEVPADTAIKQRLAAIVHEVVPDIVVIMTETDHWTDHASIARAGKDAVFLAHTNLFKETRPFPLLLRFAAGANQTYQFQPDTFVDITGVIDQKARVFNEFDTIVSDKAKYVSEMTLFGSEAQGFPKKMSLRGHADVVVAAARHWGALARGRYAEAFQSVQYTTRSLW